MKRFGDWYDRNVGTISACVLTAVVAAGAAAIYVQHVYRDKLQTMRVEHAESLARVGGHCDESLENVGAECLNTIDGINAQWRVAIIENTIELDCARLPPPDREECAALVPLMFEVGDGAV